MMENERQGDVGRKRIKGNYHKKKLVARLLPDTAFPGQVELLRVVIQDKYSMLDEGDLKPCGHAELAASIFQRAQPAVLQAAQRKCRCDLCDTEGDIWLCLTCLGMFCSREGEGHGLKHFRETGHCVILSLVTLNFWCYAHEQYLEHDFYPSLVPMFNAIHQVKHGEPAHIATENKATSPQTLFLPPCRHVESSLSKRDPPDNFSFETCACKECGDQTERWICLNCFECHCGRYVRLDLINFSMILFDFFPR